MRLRRATTSRELNRGIPLQRVNDNAQRVCQLSTVLKLVRGACTIRTVGRKAASLRDESRAGAGWDVLLLEDGEPLFSRRCSTEREACYVAEVFKQDTMRGGWTEA